MTSSASCIRTVVTVLACVSWLACGDDDEGSADAGKDSAVDDAGPGGAGGRTGASGRGGTGGRGESGGTGGTGGTSSTCTEPIPAEPVTCGGMQCLAPPGFTMNECIVPCCLEVDGQQVCAAGSTSPMYPAACTLPSIPDTTCPNYPAGTGDTEYAGCCTPQGKCGFISPVRPGCITESATIELPDPLPNCGSADDAGTEDAG